LRKKVSFTIKDVVGFKNAMLGWAQQFGEVIWMDSNGHKADYSSFDGILAVDAHTSITTGSTNTFEELKTYRAVTQDWIFGYLSYDLKNDLELLTSSNYDGPGFPDLYFFQPKKLIAIQGAKVSFHYLDIVHNEIGSDFKSIMEGSAPDFLQSLPPSDLRIKMRIFKDEYFNRVAKMLDRIHRGDIYEANFCQEFYAENTHIDPLQVYYKLNAISRSPFSVFLKLRDKYLLSASPERYLKKQENKIISQPIKGTAKRSLDKNEDLRLKEALAKDEKERAENIMIVDLVRNDLSKSALKGSVKVEELCKVYSFDQVHQMISTVTARVPHHIDPVDIIKETFPMGSMTGAPKVSAMRIIEELEVSKRGLYSGSVGYFTPDGDFDFNVVIRSILYNQTKKYVSYSVGSAITAKASPEKEYEECLLKAKAMREVLEK